MNDKLHIRLFGGFEVCYGKKSLPFMHSMRMCSLLVYLVLNRQKQQTRQYLSFCFWPDTTEKQARTNLRQLIHKLRKTIPNADAFLEIDKHTIRWNPDSHFSLDIASFEKLIDQSNTAALNNDDAGMADFLEKAVEHYGGDLFPECYDSWIEPIRKNLKASFMKALNTLIDYFENKRKYSKAISYAGRLLNCDNLDEHTYRVLMKLHAQNNDRTHLADIYQECEDLLCKELGIEPSEETRLLYDRLMNDPAPGNKNGKDNRTRKLQTDWPLVGRQPEWESLLNVWKSVLKGECRFVSISGDPGIGKSRLGWELLETLRRQGYTTAYTRCYETAATLSYSPVTDWLRDDSIRAELGKLNPVWLKETARLLPQLLIEYPDLPKPDPLTENWQRIQFFESLTNAFLINKKATLLFLDDLQWCDRETLEWLGYLYHSGCANNLLVLGALRPVEGADNLPLQNLLTDLRNNSKIDEIHLGRLNPDESVKLANRVSGKMENVHPDIYGESEGNPLFVVEIVRQSHFRDRKSNSTEPDSGTASDRLIQDEFSPVPPRVHEVISGRFKQLSEKSRELLWLMAAIGREFSFRLLAEASGWETGDVIESMEELQNHQIIRELPSGAYDFTHDKLREVAYFNISGARKRWFHRQIAGAIEAVNPGKTDMYNRLAYHYDRGEEFTKAINYYRYAASHARQMLANREALHYSDRALDLLDDMPEKTRGNEIERSILIGNLISLVHLHTYSSSDIPNICNRIRHLSNKMGQSTPVPVLRTLAISNLTTGNLEAANEIGREILNQAKKTGNDIELVEACYVLGTTLEKQGKFSAADKHMDAVQVHNNPDQQREHIRQYGQDPFAICKARRAFLQWKLGEKELSNRLLEEAHRDVVELDHPFSLNYVKTILVWIHILKEELKTAQNVAEEIIRSTSRYGFSLWSAYAKIFLGSAFSKQNNITGGISLTREGLSIMENNNFAIDRPYLNSLLAEALVKVNNYDDALSIMDESLERIHKTGQRSMEAEVHRIYGEICLQMNPPGIDQAKKRFQIAIEVARKQKAAGLEQRALKSLKKVQF